MQAVTSQEDLEQHRREIAGYCYRMLGSVFEADDATQETMLRAWRGLERFEGRSSVRTWLYRIATNVCWDMLRGRQRRERPMDLGPSSPADASFLGPQLVDHPWLLPMPDARSVPDVAAGDDPAGAAVGRESIRLAFVAALQHLPPRQRAVLILHEVLSWSALEVAELLDTSVASVNSALQRARATLAARHLEDLPDLVSVEKEQQELLDSFVDAFERYDIDRLATLLRDDVVQSMPPYALWLEGVDRVAQWWKGPGIDCAGSRLLATRANGCSAFAQYRRAETFGDDGGGHLPWAVHIIEVSEGPDRRQLISAICTFIGPDIFDAFDLPDRLPAA
jgi:RNA polymerase sigma-70 factor (ECF subfamily)